jgi:DNA-binding NarL/FixJ family response regulator
VPIRVVLVEDNQVFRETLELLLSLRDDVEVVASVDNGAEAAAVVGSVQPDVVLMDYRLPGLNGAEATRAVLAASPRSRVVCLTASVTKDEVDDVIAAGAVACVTKDEALDRIVSAIHGAIA